MMVHTDEPQKNVPVPCGNYGTCAVMYVKEIQQHFYLRRNQHQCSFVERTQQHQIEWEECIILYAEKN